jgi:hypothetical protein
METPAWYYVVQGQRQGPIARDALMQLLASGQLSAQEMVWREGMAEWTPARGVAELWGGGAPPPLPVGYYAPGPYASGQAMGESAGIRMLLPVGRSGWAIAAGYLGLFSVLLIPAPVALAVSLMAIRAIKKDKTKHGMGRAIFGLIMGVLGTGLLLFMLIFSRRH